jgi:hypothetical protein
MVPARGQSATGLPPEPLLPGERQLWTGRPSRARSSLADAGLSLYLLAALVLLTVLVPEEWRSFPGQVRAVAVIIWLSAAVQCAGMVVYLLIVKPRLTAGSVYQVTDYRVIVTSGLRTRSSWSAFLDQVGDPAARPHPDGSADLVLRDAPRAPLISRLGRSRVSGSFSTLGQVAIPVLRSVADPDQVRQIIVSARRQFRPTDVTPPPARESSGQLPAGVTLGAGERVLWCGRPARPSWWFGPQDLYVSAFALVWLVAVGFMGALVASHGPAGFLVVVVPLAIAGGVYPAAGRVVHRRLRISRSSYVLTNRRLIAAWQVRGQPVTVQALLDQLLPPVRRGQAIIASLAAADDLERRTGSGWQQLLWPAASFLPPVLIGVADPEAVCELIAIAQLAVRSGGEGPARTDSAMGSREVDWHSFRNGGEWP